MPRKDDASACSAKPLGPEPLVSKGLQLQLHFWDRNRISRPDGQNSVGRRYRLEQPANPGGSASTFAVIRHWQGTSRTTVDRNSRERMPRKDGHLATHGGATVKSATWSIQWS